VEPTNRRSGQRHATFALVAAGAVLLALAVLHASVIYFDIRDGYVGWVRVRFQDQTCQHESTFLRRIRLTRDGKACAAFSYPNGWHGEFMIYANADGSRQKIPLSAGAPNTPIGVDPSSNIYVFFVGTEAELARSWSSEPKTH
jgi:hypothetical protein